MNKRRMLVIPAVLLVAAAAGLWWQHRAASDSGDVRKMYGNVDMREVQLAIDANGRIAEMRVQEGQAVHKGQVLARIDSDRLQAMRDQAAAAVEAQQAVLDRMLAGSRPEDIRKARADLAAAEVQAADAEKTAKRLDTLSGQDLASKQQADNAAAAAKAAYERVKATRQVLKLVQQGPRQEDIDAARAQLKASQAQLALAEKNLAEATLVAPSDGVIRNRILEPGDMASPGRPVYTLAITDPVWVRTYVPETALGHVQPGMAAEVTTDSFPGKRYRGWVGYISPTAEFTPQSVQTEEMRSQLVYQVRIFVCNPAGEMRLGMPATVDLIAGQPQASGNSDPCHGR